MLRGYALYVAIMILFMVSLICGSLLMLYDLNDKEYYIYETDRRLRNNVESTFNELSTAEIEQGVIVKDLFGEKRDSVEMSSGNWGMLSYISVKAFSGDRSRSKSALMGPLLHSKEEYAIYLANSNKTFSLCGNTLIKGKCFIPESGVKRIHIDGIDFMGDQLIEGDQEKSTSALPEIRKEFTDHVASYLQGKFDDKDSVMIFTGDSVKVLRSFRERTLVMKNSGPMVLENIEYRGKIIIQASGWVEIKNTAILEDIVIMAPVIFIDEGFKGSGQFFASDSLMTGNDCKFLYPSVLAVIGIKDTASAMLNLGEGSKVMGAVFNYQQKQAVNNRNLLSLSKDSEVYGQVYSNGLLEIKGSVYGSVVCEKFILRTNSSIYENHLLDATVDISKLPEGFIGVSLLKENKDLDILKWLN